MEAIERIKQVWIEKNHLPSLNYWPIPIQICDQQQALSESDKIVNNFNIHHSVNMNNSMEK